MKLFLDTQWQRYWQGKDAFSEAQSINGQVFRSKEGRRTLRFVHDGRSYFLKLHEGVGWGEIFKNLSQMRLPVLGARNEYEACLRLAALDIDTMTPVAFGERGCNPARQLSFLITEDLVNTTSLEDYCRTWQESPPSVREKRAIIRKLARISKTLHDSGINHRDYYLCHFLRQNTGTPFVEKDPLYLIDLHRVQMRSTIPQRWLLKDLAGLFYSAFDLPLTRHDILHFLSQYRREWLQTGSTVPDTIAHKAAALYRKDFGKPPPAHILSFLNTEKH